MKFHYARAVPVSTIGYNIYNDSGEWCGVVLYGRGANHNLGNEYNLKQGEIAELVRVALNGKQECTSKAVAMTLKQLHKDCPLIRLVVSYADCDQNHLGTIYQATNWIFVGTKEVGVNGGWIIKGQKVHKRTISGRIKRMGGLKGMPESQFIKINFDPNAQKFISKGKRKYLMPMDKKIRKQLIPLALPYPKNDANWTKINRTKFINNGTT